MKIIGQFCKINKPPNKTTRKQIKSNAEMAGIN